MPIARNLSHTSTFPNLQIHHWHLESVDGQAVAPSLHIQTGNDDSKFLLYRSFRLVLIIFN